MRHLRILELVDEVARTGSIRRAAARLNFTASALTRRIQDLEFELGVVLFERTSRGMRPTTAGDMFLAHTREQLAEAERLKSGLEDLQGLRRGKVRVACSQAVAPEFMPRAIGVFRGLYPMVDFDVRVVDHEQAATTRQGFERGTVVRHLPAMLLDEHLAQRDDVLGLGAEKTNGANMLDQLIFTQGEHFLWCINRLEKLFCRLVHTHISRLCGQHDGNQKGIGVAIFEFGCRGRVRAGQASEKFLDRVFFHHGHNTSRLARFIVPISHHSQLRHCDKALLFQTLSAA